ncbi:MAG TPA: rubredoxin [Methanoregulaceae archaeon]|nr:rubredoxin [Methanoregulaceae archaeon]
MMTKYVCPVCGYTYDPEKGDAYSGARPGTEFDQLPANWTCPICLTPKEKFLPSG